MEVTSSQKDNSFVQVHGWRQDIGTNTGGKHLKQRVGGRVECTRAAASAAWSPGPPPDPLLNGSSSSIMTLHVRSEHKPLLAKLDTHARLAKMYPATAQHLPDSRRLPAIRAPHPQLQALIRLSYRPRPRRCPRPRLRITAAAGLFIARPLLGPQTLRCEASALIVAPRQPMSVVSLATYRSHKSVWLTRCWHMPTKPHGFGAGERIAALQQTRRTHRRNEFSASRCTPTSHALFAVIPNGTATFPHANACVQRTHRHVSQTKP